MFGEKIEEYEILEHLGKGGFAHVYRARCRKSGTFVAIKMIDKALMASAGMVGRVRQEVTIHSRLKHPAILELYTFFEDAHYVYLVLELAHNGELAKHFRLGTRGLSEKAAADIFKQVVSGVMYLHSHNIIHRDLSLNNLLLTKDLNVKIADFGLATQLNGPDEKHVTMCGTPNYISPEVASREVHGLPADVWGLGCMLYTLLVGSPPFHTQHVKSTLNRVINADYRIPAELSTKAQDLLQKLLCRDPMKRITLKGIIEHPFLNFSMNSVTNSIKDDLSRDSGFHTTLHSTQHTRLRSECKVELSSISDSMKNNKHNNVECHKLDSRPTSFNVLTGIHDSNVLSTHSNGNSYCNNENRCGIFNEKSSQTNVSSSPKTNYCYDYLVSENLKDLKLSGDLQNGNKYEINEFKQKIDKNKENFPVYNINANTLSVPPLCASRLPILSHRTRNALLKIESGAVVVEFIKKKGKERQEKVTEVCKISKDGMKIMVYSVDCKPLSSGNTLEDYKPTSDEVFSYHNLPQKHWKKYLYASRFVDLVKAKTPKITLYTPLAKCQLMENGTDVEMFFYSGEKLTFTSTEGLRIIDKNSKTHNNPSKTAELKNICDHFEECSSRMSRVEAALTGIPDECFPLIIGKRPTNHKHFFLSFSPCDGEERKNRYGLSVRPTRTDLKPPEAWHDFAGSPKALTFSSVRDYPMGAS
ncbi:hypothetical protein EVAR_74683_1 [Eumeta japonica]|uniref:Serine/threonine-protein kinase PLK4 n=1 Tax=Eumeta variegata TaxID=151549 RepID=A0A4C1YIJ1_EUMVA|nr:hypothetical protein EVAR_74683_1 [Eumeta japonica]